MIVLTRDEEGSFYGKIDSKLYSSIFIETIVTFLLKHVYIINLRDPWTVLDPEFQRTTKRWSNP